MKSITRFLFVTTQIAALVWVTSSYGIALYSTLKLGTAFPVESVSTQAIATILGNNALKVIENSFEHNEGGLFGHSVKKQDDEAAGE